MPIIDYTDPNAVWRMTGYDPYKGMSEQERMKAGCFQGIAFLATLFIMMLLFALF